MKTLLLLLITLTSFCSFSQDSTYVAFYKPETDQAIGDNIPYLVGSKEIPGYGLEIRSCQLDDSVNLPNGRKIAGLNCIISEAEFYKGGLLTFNQDTTTIVGMSVEPIGNDGAKFSVEGEDFSVGFTLSNGAILAYEDRYSVFNTKGLGVWKIEKK